MASLALVVLDTLRKESFDDHFEWLPGRRFENAWAPSHWTVPVHASLFAGKYPSELGVYANHETLDCPDPVVAERASDAGYRTRAFSANGNISDHFRFDRGFEQFIMDWRAEGWREEMTVKSKGDVFDWKRFNNETELSGLRRSLTGVYRTIAGPYDTALSLRYGFNRKMRGPGSPKLSSDPTDFGSTQAIDFVESTTFGEQEFLFINLMEAHNPYEPPEEYQTVEPVRINGLEYTVDGPSVDPNRIRAAYDDSVRYLADQYRMLFDLLSEAFDYVITLSDHGELLGERDEWEHLCGIQPEVTNVPLCVSGPDVPEDERTELVSLLDVHQTMLDLMGLEGPSRGEHLLSDVDRSVALTEFHGLSDLHRRSLPPDIDERIEYMNVDRDGIALPPWYYGYETVTDEFAERGECPVEDPQLELNAARGGLTPRQSERERYDEMSEDVMNRLEELGYA
jgi:arylsulfatase A-like enzyme